MNDVYPQEFMQWANTVDLAWRNLPWRHIALRSWNAAISEQEKRGRNGNAQRHLADPVVCCGKLTHFRQSAQSK